MLENVAVKWNSSFSQNSDQGEWIEKERLK